MAMKDGSRRTLAPTRAAAVASRVTSASGSPGMARTTTSMRAAVATLRTSEQPAEHGQVPNPALGRVVVEESHRTQSEVLDALQVSSQRLAGRARSDDQGP